MAIVTKDLRGVGLLDGSPGADLTETSGDWLESVNDPFESFGGPSVTDLIESTNSLSR
jgi:hypothetical protein